MHTKGQSIWKRRLSVATLLVIYASSKTGYVCIVSEGPGENSLPAWPDTGLQEEMGLSGITHSFLPRTSAGPCCGGVI